MAEGSNLAVDIGRVLLPPILGSIVSFYLSRYLQRYFWKRLHKRELRLTTQYFDLYNLLLTYENDIDDEVGRRWFTEISLNHQRLQEWLTPSLERPASPFELVASLIDPMSVEDEEGEQIEALTVAHRSSIILDPYLIFAAPHAVKRKLIRIFFRWLNDWLVECLNSSFLRRSVDYEAVSLGYFRYLHSNRVLSAIT